MSVVVSIVEGEGEVEALPILLRRLNAWLTPGHYAEVKTPIRVRRDRFLNKAERMEAGAYRECTDQPAFSNKMDLNQAFDRSRSFRKLCSEWKIQMA